MLKIGELAQICGVDVQTLRYYDKLGILTPNHVDEDSGYRYYLPSKEKDFRLISELKELGFSLKEIKTFLSATEEEQKALYAKRRRALQEQIQNGEEKLRRIENSFDLPTTQAAPFSFFGTTFENDPSVVGKWEFCGVLPEHADFTDECILLPKEIPLKELFFLPGGGHVWNYFWTKGTLFFLLSPANICIPNEYRFATLSDKRYLLLHWYVDRYCDEAAPIEIRVYRQLDSRTYTEKQTFRYIDEVELPFVADSHVVGAWEVFDLIESPKDFSVSPCKKDKTAFLFREIAFSERGMCYKLFSGSAGGTPKFFSYTKGLVLDREMSFAEPYEIITQNGEDYLILAHKSGDYAYLGEVFCYYVFRRKKEPS